MTTTLIVAGLILITDILLVLFVRGADERRSEQTRRIKRMEVTR